MQSAEGDPGTLEPKPFVIRPRRGRLALEMLSELFDNRDLLYFFARRDIKIRYAQAALGVAWVVIQPVLSMIVLTLIFGRIHGLATWDGPYPLFAYAALMPWQLFSRTIETASESILENKSLMTKVYFPRIALPASGMLARLFDFSIALAAFFVLLFIYGRPPTATVLLLPLFLGLVIAAALGVGLVVSALNVRYRDAQYIMPFLLQLWMFATPVVYSRRAVVPERWNLPYSLNPLVGVVEGFRLSLLGSSDIDTVSIVASAGSAFALLALGVFYFKRTERSFADEL
jgi:lipopolysaccharide transport system permease protein